MAVTHLPCSVKRDLFYAAEHIVDLVSVESLHLQLAPIRRSLAMLKHLNY
jgi:hypothetical protein